MNSREIRSVTDRNATGHLIRLHIGLESLKDLIANLEAGFDRMVRQISAKSVLALKEAFSVFPIYHDNLAVF